jgi:hypothetical protein
VDNYKISEVAQNICTYNTDPPFIIFLCSEMQAQLKVVAEAMEQKAREEQKLLSHDDGNNWYGNDPILCLIHTYDKTKIQRAYMRCHDVSNKRIVMDNMKSLEKREETVWQKMVNMWNNKKIAPTTIVVITQIIDAVC